MFFVLSKRHETYYVKYEYICRQYRHMNIFYFRRIQYEIRYDSVVMVHPSIKIKA